MRGIIKVMPKQKNKINRRLSGNKFRVMVFMLCGTLSFVLGLKTSMEPISVTEAQISQTTNLNVTLQYQPVDGSSAQPIVLSEFSATNTAMFILQNIYSGEIIPASPVDRCRFTSQTGRCTVFNIPVGEEPVTGNQADKQYDIIVNPDYIEYITGIRIESDLVHIRYDEASCEDGTSFNVASGGTWCLGKQGEAYPAVYDVMITLNERDDCTGTNQPTPTCNSAGDIVTFECNGSWQSLVESCDPVQCPDGNYVSGMCEEVVDGLASCSQFAACRNNQQCIVNNFGQITSYDAGLDTITINGTDFGAFGGYVSFPTIDGDPEIVQVFPGVNWTDTRIRVRVPLRATTGILKVHPNAHGFKDVSGEATAITCNSPIANIRSFSDQFDILAVAPIGQDAASLVAPGFATEFNILVQHNVSVGHLQSVKIELLDGAFTDPNNLPTNRTVIEDSTCNLAFDGSVSREEMAQCSIPISSYVDFYDGPFTFLFTLSDSYGNTAKAVLLDAGESALIGDFNTDGRLTIEDAVFALRLSTGRMSTQQQHLLRDTDGDNQVTFSDVLFVLHSITQ